MLLKKHFGGHTGMARLDLHVSRYSQRYSQLGRSDAFSGYQYLLQHLVALLDRLLVSTKEEA